MLTKFRTFLGRSPISFTAQTLFYPVVLVAAFVFAEKYKTTVAHAVLVFVLVLPIGALLQLILARLFVSASVRVSENTAKKRSFVNMTASVRNACIMPFAFVELVMTLPDERGVKMEEKCFLASLLPFSDCRIERGIKFEFRGEYDVFLSHVFVYDLSRSVRLRIDINNSARVFVLPRRRILAPSDTALTYDDALPYTSPMPGMDGSDMSDTRVFEVGDSLKRVHWKLSSKSEDIIVRRSNQNGGSHVYVMCDLEAHYKTSGECISGYLVHPDGEDIVDPAGADAVVESAIAVVQRELSCGNTITLLWVENGEAVSVELESNADFEAVFRRFGAAKPDLHRGHFARIKESLVGDVGARIVAITSHVTPKLAHKYVSLFYGLRGTGVELLISYDESVFLPLKNTERLEACMSTLLLGGIDAKIIKL